MIISKTPYRISFFGGGSDYPNWYNNYSGSVLSTTIDNIFTLLAGICLIFLIINLELSGQNLSL